MGRVTFPLVFVALMTVMAGRSSAFADSGEDPENLIRQGVELRRKGDDLRAEGYLKRAYHIARTPRTSAQLGLVELALGEFVDANQHLTEALESDDPWVGKERAVIEESRNRARSHLAKVEVLGAKTTTTVKVGTRDEVVVPPDGTLWVAPGTTMLVVRMPAAEPATKTVTVGAGETTSVRIESPASSVAVSAAGTGPPRSAAYSSRSSPEGPNADGNRGLKTGGVVAVAAGICAMATGGIFYVIATNKLDAIRNATPTHRFGDSDLNWRTYDRTGVGFMVGGAIAAAAGAALVVIGRHDNRAVGSSEASASVVIDVVPGGVQLCGIF